MLTARVSCRCRMVFTAFPTDSAWERRPTTRRRLYPADAASTAKRRTSWVNALQSKRVCVFAAAVGSSPLLAHFQSCGIRVSPRARQLGSMRKHAESWGKSEMRGGVETGATRVVFAPFKFCKCLGTKDFKVAPQVGLEPTTLRLTAVLMGWSKVLWCHQIHTAEMLPCSGNCSMSYAEASRDASCSRKHT
jgi:hypothetical protein